MIDIVRSQSSSMPVRVRDVTFALIWSRWGFPLAGRTAVGLNGLENRIVSVDWNGVVRVSRNGLESRIPIEPFRWTIAHVLGRGAVERKDIHREFPHRYSSGVQLVLEQIPLFKATGRPAVIRLRDDWMDRLT